MSAPAPKSPKSPKSTVVLGTSGWSFPDWVGPFYPPGTERGKMLGLYVREFSAVEVTSTYYRIPHWRRSRRSRKRRLRGSNSS